MKCFLNPGSLGLSVLIFLFLLLSCSRSTNRQSTGDRTELPYQVDLTTSPSRDLFLSDFADEITYVKLESRNVVVGGTCTVKAGSDCFIINDHNQELLAFSRNGKYLNKIGMIGKGPTEYPYISPDYQIDPNTNEVSVPFNDNEVNIYSITGGFLRNMKFPEFRSNAILFVNSRFYVSRRAAPTGSYVPLELYQPEGTKYREYSFPLPELKGTPTYSPIVELTRTLSNDVVLNRIFGDTAFIVTAQGDWKPFVVFNRGAGKMPENEAFFGTHGKSYPDGYYSLYLKDLGKILVMVTCHGEDSYFSFFNKKTGKFFRYNNTSRCESAKAYTIQNDLDGGPGLIYHHSICDNYLYCVHQAIDLIEWKKSGYFDRIEPKFPEMKKKLFAMIDSLKPDDNPVIMIVKLQE